MDGYTRAGCVVASGSAGSRRLLKHAILVGIPHVGGVMERHEIEAELTAKGAQELLEATSDAHLAYTGTDGTPRVIPVGYFWTGEEFVISTADTAPKVDALSARPDVALAIDRGDTPGQARALSVRGRARITIVDGLVEEYLAAARKSMGAEAAAEFERNCRQMYDRMARIAITPTWVRFYDFGAGRMPRFLTELANRSRS
jgi:nitroimidazol reductase NimA-like FMN-containing flavoprotein (pyridoxamine 5'-phosphate oxidase superfamily)